MHLLASGPTACDPRPVSQIRWQRIWMDQMGSCHQFRLCGGLVFFFHTHYEEYYIYIYYLYSSSYQ